MLLRFPASIDRARYMLGVPWLQCPVRSLVSAAREGSIIQGFAFFE